MNTQEKSPAQKREEIFMGCFALATVFGLAGVCSIPFHEPTAYVLGGLCALSIASGGAMGALEMGIDIVKHIQAKTRRMRG